MIKQAASRHGRRPFPARRRPLRTSRRKSSHAFCDDCVAIGILVGVTGLQAREGSCDRCVYVLLAGACHLDLTSGKRMQRVVQREERRLASEKRSYLALHTALGCVRTAVIVNEIEDNRED